MCCFEHIIWIMFSNMVQTFTNNMLCAHYICFTFSSAILWLAVKYFHNYLKTLVELFEFKCFKIKYWQRDLGLLGCIKVQNAEMPIKWNWLNLKVFYLLCHIFYWTQKCIKSSLGGGAAFFNCIFIPVFKVHNGENSLLKHI